MKKSLLLFLSLIVLLSISACSEKKISDPPQLTERWQTVYDTEAEGISENWYINFPVSNFFGSTWDDWRLKNARYRWHRQSFRVAELDSTAFYLLECHTVAGPSLLWLNGEFLDQVEFTDHYVMDITSLLKANTINELVIRNEYKTDSFGIHKISIEKSPEAVQQVKKTRDYTSMPLYHRPPAYIDDLIIYKVFMRNLSPSATFTGLQNSISRLNQLGMNMVWLMPVHPIGEKNRSGTLGSPYAVRDHFTTNENYGSLPQFNSMRSMLHRNNMKLILDAPAGQTAADHTWVTDYPAYYRRNERGEFLAPGGGKGKDIFALDYENANLRQRMFTYFDFWTRQGADGFFCHGSADIPGEFWQDLRDRYNQEGNNPLLLAGSNEADHMLYGMNAVPGWDLYHAFRAIAKGEADATAIGTVLAKEKQEYPDGTRVFHFTENHDTPRAVRDLGVDEHHLALFIIFTAPGIPVIFNGEELIDPPLMDLNNKTDVNWYRIHWPTYNLISQLARFRKSSPILTRGDLRQIADTKAVGGFSRRFRNETWYILFNYSDTEQIYQCDVRTTVFSDGSSEVIRNGRVRLKPKGYCIVK
jgi:glycosidase